MTSFLELHNLHNSITDGGFLRFICDCVLVRCFVSLLSHYSHSSIRDTTLWSQPTTTDHRVLLIDNPAISFTRIVNHAIYQETTNDVLLCDIRCTLIALV